MGASRVSPRRVSPPCHRRVTDYYPLSCHLPGTKHRREGVSAVTQEEERSLTDAKLEMLFPSVPWRDPIRISDDGDFGFACRFCIARYGIEDGDIPSLSMS